METRPVLRIFISSTAVDLREYRDKVRDAVLRLENLPIAMETFSAMSGQPVGECTRMAAEADAVVCIVAHRYGYVPPPELGGDGERSLTWLEVDAAKRAGKPVFAFVVDSSAPWAELKEQDRLVSEPEKATEIIQSVKKLQGFKAYLGREFMVAAFSTSEELAKLVAITLARLTPRSDHVVSTAQVEAPERHGVWVVHGRDLGLRDSMFDFLRAIGLHPIDWSEVVSRTGGGAAPYIGSVLENAFAGARAVVVLLSPDDQAWLRPDLRDKDEPHHETNLTYQSRPNVLFEAGMAFAYLPRGTVLLELAFRRQGD